MSNTPKYSILIPTRNSIDYLKDCINSVIQQKYINYELIISDNHSDDGTYDYVKSLNHSNISLIKPQEPLAMVDHWEWLLKHAKGDWVIFLGSDDGLMPYFFEVSDYLVARANKKNIKAINSSRAYFFWEGCQKTYGNTNISYSAVSSFRIKNTKLEILNATIGLINYIDLPQMYTTSIVHKSIIKKTREKNLGYFYSDINPDANGAANICSSEKKYIESLVPLGWVGSSIKSNGLLYGLDREKYIRENTINPKPIFIKWNQQAGLFNKHLHNLKIYLFEALLQTRHLQTHIWEKIYSSKIFKIILFANVYSEIKNKEPEKTICLKETLTINNISFGTVRIVEKVWKYIKRIVRKIQRLAEKLNAKTLVKKINFKMEYPSDSALRLMDAYKHIDKLAVESGFIKEFIRDFS
ncbi:MAG: glycosyltransferase family 2 protein [Treponema sp.]|nr:glycosyltransferase family 2 protein [Treponema sp.]